MRNLNEILDTVETERARHYENSPETENVEEEEG